MNPRGAFVFAFLTLSLLPIRAGSLIDACNYPDDASAAKAWIASKGSPAPVMREANGTRELTFACQLTDKAVDRNYWDREVTLDLADSEGVQFDIQAPDLGPIAHFSLYFRTGDGWKSCTFSPRRAKTWETVTIQKSEARDEGKAGGWDTITTLRLAAWKGNGADTEFQIRNLKRIGVLGEDTRIVLARGESDSKDPFAGQLSKQLTGLGLRHALIGESALTPALLAKAELVLLPHNPALPEAATAALKTYVQNGGNLMAFYVLPSALREVAGIESFRFLKPEPAGQFSAIHAVKNAFPDAPEIARQESWNVHAPEIIPDHARVLAEWHDAAGKPTGIPAVCASDRVVFMSHVLLDDGGPAKARLLLAMAGLLRPDCWREVIASHRERMGHLAGWESYEAAREALRKLSKPGSEAHQRLDEAEKLRQAGEELEKQSHFAAALDAIDSADRKMREAYCLAQEPKAGEFRAMWCHYAYGVKGMSWDAAIARLKENGFNAILPNMLWGGVAFYPSEVLPEADVVKEKGDAIAECLAACRKHDVKIHVWKVNWNLGHAVPPAFVDRMRAEQRLQSSASGDEQPWLCPSHPENLKLERESLLEVARKYAVDGIHFDYIRYPGADYCFCKPCRERFEKATAKPVTKWPEEVRPGGARREDWITWCQGNITALVRSTSEEVRKIRPGIQVSAAVFRNWDVDSRTVMQDWKLWCEKGWLDFVCPMDYTNSDSTFETWVARQKELCGPAALIPGIGASSSHSTMTADQVISQIGITRRHDTKGFIIFNYGEREANETIPMLGLGITRP